MIIGSIVDGSLIIRHTSAKRIKYYTPNVLENFGNFVLCSIAGMCYGFRLRTLGSLFYGLFGWLPKQTSSVLSFLAILYTAIFWLQSIALREPKNKSK
jgi:hypothetical protein